MSRDNDSADSCADDKIKLIGFSTEAKSARPQVRTQNTECDRRVESDNIGLDLVMLRARTQTYTHAHTHS